MIVTLLAACTADSVPGDLGHTVWDPEGAGFFDTPWPSDQRLDADGTLSLASFPNPFDVSLVDRYLEQAEGLHGFGTNSPVWIRFEETLDPALLPTPEESVLPGSSLVLLDVDRDSAWFGERIPVQWQQLEFDGSAYAPAHLLAVAPVFGYPLRPATKYALAITTDLAERDPDWAREWSDPDLDHALSFAGLDADEIAIATTFTTQDPIEELGRIAWFVQNEIGPPDFDVVLEHLVDHTTYTAYRTHYRSPVFTNGIPPYVVEGGEFRFDSDGRPIVVRWDDMRLAVCTPVGVPAPPEGWPVVIFQHGTGGDYRGFCDSDGALETAKRLGEVGIIGVGIDQPLHGSRPGAETASDLAHFNIVNPESASTNFRQGAIDAIYLARSLARQPWTFRTEDGQAFSTNPDKILFMGHSQGGLTGALAAPFFAGDVQATMLSGAGGVLAVTIVERKDPLDFGELVRQLLALPDEEPLTPLHPVLGLVQTLVEITDPVNYAPYWSSQAGPWANQAPSPVLLTSGTLDAATPYRTAVALAAAGRLPLVGEPATRCEAVRMRVGLPLALPSTDNCTAFDGSLHTSGFAQYLDGTHFVVFEERAASDLVTNWLASTAYGQAALWSEDE